MCVGRVGKWGKFNLGKDFWVSEEKGGKSILVPENHVVKPSGIHEDDVVGLREHHRYGCLAGLGAQGEREEEYETRQVS